MMRFALIPENYKEEMPGSLHSWHFTPNQPVMGFNLMWSEGSRELPSGVEEITAAEGWRLLDCAPKESGATK